VSKPTGESLPIPAEEQGLWEALRACRQSLANEQDVPPYVIFHDKTLRQMLALRPNSDAELLDISGIGQVKLDRYGQRFLSVLRDQISATGGEDEALI
jgi:ATP-dependent DNA helicase RecQ